MHARDGGIDRGGRRPPRPRQDHHPRRFRDAARRPQHPAGRHRARPGSPPARFQARRHARLRAGEQAQPHDLLGRPQPQGRRHHRRQELSRRPPGARRARPRRGRMQRHRPAPLQGRLSVADQPPRPVGVRAGSRAHHRGRGEALAHRSPGPRGTLRHRQPAGLHRQEGRARKLAVPGQGRARSQRHRHLHRRAPARSGAQRRDRGAGRAPQGSPARARGDRGRRRPHSVFLLGLSAQLLDRGAGRQPRLCRHRLPLHGAVDGPLDLGLHPDGRRGHQLDRRSAVLQASARIPESRRRHLQSFGLARSARRHPGRRQHHL